MWLPAFNNILLHLLLVVNLSGRVEPNPDAKRLYDDLLSNYNRLIRSDRESLCRNLGCSSETTVSRPVANNTDKITVKMGLKLSQLVDLVSPSRPSPGVIIIKT